MARAFEILFRFLDKSLLLSLVLAYSFGYLILIFGLSLLPVLLLINLFELVLPQGDTILFGYWKMTVFSWWFANLIGIPWIVYVLYKFFYRVAFLSIAKLTIDLWNR